jgi:hypothetical protein
MAALSNPFAQPTPQPTPFPTTQPEALSLEPSAVAAQDLPVRPMFCSLPIGKPHHAPLSWLELLGER